MSKRYLVLNVPRGVSNEVRDKITNIYQDSEIIIPYHRDMGSYYIYVDENETDKVLPILEEYCNFINLYQYADESEISTFLNEVDKENELKAGDKVQIDGYGDMVFTIIDKYEGLYRVKADLRNYTVTLQVESRKIKKHTNPEYYMLTHSISREYLGVIVLDVRYIQKMLNLKGFPSKINFLIRMKIQTKGYKICLSFDEDYREPEWELLAEILGLGTSVGCMARGEILLSDQLHLMQNFSGIVTFNDDNGLEFVEMETENKKRLSLFHYLTYLKQKEVIKESLAKTELKNFLLTATPEEIKNRFRKYAVYLEKMDHIENFLCDPIEHEFDDSRLYRFIRNNKLTWFLENYDFYVNTIRG